MKGYFKSLSLINTAAVCVVLSTDARTQMKPNFTSKKCKFGVKNTIQFLDIIRGSNIGISVTLSTDFICKPHRS
jgi:hypothetical protein